jgi:hypothetical protein
LLKLDKSKVQVMRSLADIIILPPYAKYLFSLSDLFKKTIIDLISAYVQVEFLDLDWYKLESFIKTFYANKDTSFLHYSKCKSYF